MAVWLIKPYNEKLPNTFKWQSDCQSFASEGLQAKSVKF